MDLNLIFSALYLVGLVLGYADPRLCTGICNNSHDPSIIRRPDGTYFRFSTGNKISIHTASDITGPWEYKGSMLPNGSSINLDGNHDLWVCGCRITETSPDLG
jgi:arabinan endo-1,5-alpha-L-arabinosidase